MDLLNRKKRSNASCLNFLHFIQMVLIFFFIWQQIDSIMSTRTTNENEASRRLKSEFLIQFDGVTSNPDDIVIVIGKHYIWY